MPIIQSSYKPSESRYRQGITARRDAPSHAERYGDISICRGDSPRASTYAQFLAFCNVNQT